MTLQYIFEQCSQADGAEDARFANIVFDDLVRAAYGDTEHNIRMAIRKLYHASGWKLVDCRMFVEDLYNGII